MIASPLKFKVEIHKLNLSRLAGCILLALFCHCSVSAQDHTSQFNSTWLKSVVSMEECSTPTNSQAIGTGFLVGSSHNHVILITAKHVVLNGEGKVNPNLGWRLNEKTNNSDLMLDQAQTAFLNSGWFISTNSDVACRIIAFANGNDFALIPLSSLLSQSNLNVGAHILVLGFPMGLRSEAYISAIARSGIVARSDKNELMLDCFVFPGNSGGPVLYSPYDKFDSRMFSSSLIGEEKLIGVVIDYIPYTDVAISPQTHRPRISFEENSGLSHAVTSDQILELLNRADFVAVDSK